MKFNEQFPSLKGKRFCGWEYQCDDDECSLYVQDVEEHCLDKAKVKRDTLNIAITAINKWREQVLVIEGDKESPEFKANTREALKNLNQLKKEVGLD